MLGKEEREFVRQLGRIGDRDLGTAIGNVPNDASDFGPSNVHPGGRNDGFARTLAPFYTEKASTNGF
jgi:hypothetical protein